MGPRAVYWTLAALVEGCMSKTVYWLQYLRDGDPGQLTGSNSRDMCWPRVVYWQQ